MHQSIKNADIEHVLKDMYFATISQTYINFTRAIDLLFTRYTSSAILAFTLHVCGLYARHAKKRGDKSTMRLCENCAKCIEDHLPGCDEQKAISSVLMQLREQPSIF
ncbi:hypothetical protein AB4619_04630 [Vibrio splendidus]